MMSVVRSLRLISFPKQLSAARVLAAFLRDKESVFWASKKFVRWSGKW